MKKYILLLFSCFLLSLCCWSQKKDCDVLFKSAIEHYNNGEYELAMSCFNRIIEKCGEGGDYRGSLSKIEDCKLKINSSNVTFYLEKNEISFGPQGGMEIVEVSSNASCVVGLRRVRLILRKTPLSCRSA